MENTVNQNKSAKTFFIIVVVIIVGLLGVMFFQRFQGTSSTNTLNSSTPKGENFQQEVPGQGQTMDIPQGSQPGGQGGYIYNK